MSETSATMHDSTDDPMNMEMLINRIVDGEASVEQRQRFEALAADDSALWRRLAVRQQDMAMLATHVEPTLNAAERVDLPSAGHARDNAVLATIGDHGVHHKPLSWWAAAAGWAAVIALVAAWGVVERLGGGRLDHGLGGDARTVSLQTPEEHLQQYLTAPFVLGKMPDTLLNVEQLPDGRWAMSSLRRFVEVTFYDSPEQIPLDADGNLTTSPHELPRAVAPTPAPIAPKD